MYNSDKPIENFNEDVLGRAFFARQLATAILAFDSKDNFTIGLYGKWGSGKTSIINMVIEEIENQRKSGSNSNIPIIAQFSPWNFSDTNQLINQFFKRLRNSLNIKSKNVISEKVGEALEEYAGAFDYIDAVPVLGRFSKMIKLTSIFTGKQLKSKFSNIDILAAKEKLVKNLKEQEKKILVIIDDIDRLSNEQIKLIFQLVNSVAGLPNIMYLLSMDKEVVIRALESVQNCNGAEYLEKVVQLPFDIPKLDKSKLFELLFRKLDDILKNKSEVNIDNIHWGKVFRGCIEPFVKNVRDVNRIVNTFQFKYNMIYNEVNFSDMLGLTTLQVLVPNIVQWIYINQEKICGGVINNVGWTYDKQKKRKAEYLKTFEEVCSAPSENVLNAICSLFPRVAKEVSTIMYENISEDKLRHDQRIADPQKFKIYFNLDISQIGVSRELMSRSIYKLEDNDNYKLIDNLNENGNIINYLRELRSCIDDIPVNRIPMFVKMLYKKRNTLTGNTRKSFIPFSAKDYCDWCIKPLMERIESEDERFLIYKYMLLNIDLDTLQTMAEEINRIELSFGRLAAKDKAVSKKEHNPLIKIIIDDCNDEDNIKDGIRELIRWRIGEEFYANFGENFKYDNCFSINNTILTFCDGMNNEYKLKTTGYISPSSGDSDDIDIYLFKGDKIIEEGNINIYYGFVEYDEDENVGDAAQEEINSNIDGVISKLIDVKEGIISDLQWRIDKLQDFINLLNQ